MYHVIAIQKHNVSTRSLTYCITQRTCVTYNTTHVQRKRRTTCHTQHKNTHNTMENSNKNNNIVTVECKTSFDKNSKQRSLTLNIDYSDVERTTLMKKAANYDRIQFQRALRTSFKSDDVFQTFHDDNNEWNVHSSVAGHQIVTPETRMNEIQQMINTLPEPQRSEMIAKMNEQQS